MRNNCWYAVRPDVVKKKDDGVIEIFFRHPREPGTGDEGWIESSTEQQIADAKLFGNSPEEQFTRGEIEKHDGKRSCWLVFDGKVYEFPFRSRLSFLDAQIHDATRALEWHPGGEAATLIHTGKVHRGTSD